MPPRKEQDDEPLDAYRRIRKPVPPPTKVVPDRRRRIREDQAERERRRGELEGGARRSSPDPDDGSGRTPRSEGEH